MVAPRFWHSAHLQEDDLLLWVVHSSLGTLLGMVYPSVYCCTLGQRLM